MPWLSLSAFRHQYAPVSPESAGSLRNTAKVCAGLLHSVSGRNKAGFRAWHAASAESRDVLRDWLVRERKRGHPVEVISEFAILQAADTIVGQSQGQLPGLDDFRPAGPAAQRALALLREHEVPSSKRTKKGHIVVQDETRSPEYRKVCAEAADRYGVDVTTVDLMRV